MVPPLVLAACAWVAGLAAHGEGGLEAAPATHTLPASAFPAFFRAADGGVRLVSTGLGPDHSSLRVHTPLAAPGWEEAGLELARGTGWFLNWADFAAVERFADGAYLALWLAQDGAQAHSYGTRFQIVEPGASRAAARPLEEHRGPGEHGFVSLAPLDEQRLLALWLDGRDMDAHGDGAMQLLARSVARDGTLGPEQVVDPSCCSCCPTALVRLADGTHLAAWRDRSADEVRDISVARFADGHWSEPQPVHADGWRIEGCPVNGPRLAANAERVAAAWYTGIDGSVRVSFADALGRGFGRALRVDEGGAEGRGDAVFLADGSLLVGWMEHEEGRASWRLRRVWADGTLGAVLVLAPVASERSSGFLRLMADGGGAWSARTELRPERAVVLQRVEPAR